MNTKGKSSKNEKSWIVVIITILLIFIVGYIFYNYKRQIQRKEEFKKFLQDKFNLEIEKNRIKNRLKEIDQKLDELSKYRIQKLTVARITLVVIIIGLNIVYYTCVVPKIEKHGYMIDHFSDFTAFLILMYSAVAFLVCGTMKVFSEKIHGALFAEVFTEEQELFNEKEQLEFQIQGIEIKLLEIEKTKNDLNY
jgi:uncharacterized membrane protein YidH (DUF202 family)